MTDEYVPVGLVDAEKASTYQIPAARATPAGTGYDGQLCVAVNADPLSGVESIVLDDLTARVLPHAGDRTARAQRGMAEPRGRMSDTLPTRAEAMKVFLTEYFAECCLNQPTRDERKAAVAAFELWWAGKTGVATPAQNQRVLEGKPAGGPR